MKKKLFSVCVALIIIFCTPGAYSQFFLGAGAVFSMPQGKFKETNQNSTGYILQLESRAFCNVWYGLRIDYINYEKNPANPDINYLKDAVLLSPEFRYNFFSENCYKNVMLPYLQVMLTYSSIGGTDNANRSGLGAAGGAGLVFPFRLFGVCWSIDMNAQYMAPNFIFRSEDRNSIQAFNFSINLSAGL
jgi:hypothetical protein